MTNNESRTVSIPMDYLDDDVYTAEIFKGGPDVTNNPNNIVKKKEGSLKKIFLK